MLDWIRCFFLRERRKSATPVLNDRRLPRMSAKLADEKLYESIDRFNQTIVRKREDLHK